MRRNFANEAASKTRVRPWAAAHTLQRVTLSFNHCRKGEALHPGTILERSPALARKYFNSTDVDNVVFRGATIRYFQLMPSLTFPGYLPMRNPRSTHVCLQVYSVQSISPNDQKLGVCALIYLKFVGNA